MISKGSDDEQNWTNVDKISAKLTEAFRRLNY